MLLLLSFSDFRIPPLYFRCVLHAFFAYVPSSGYSLNQARSQVFSKGGWSYGSKSLEKEKLLVIRIVKEST